MKGYSALLHSSALMEVFRLDFSGIFGTGHEDRV